MTESIHCNMQCMLHSLTQSDVNKGTNSCFFSAQVGHSDTSISALTLHDFGWFHVQTNMRFGRILRCNLEKIVNVTFTFEAISNAKPTF